MSHRMILWAGLALLLIAAWGSAAADVFVTSPGTAQILVLDGAGGVRRAIGTAGGMSQPYGIAMDASRNLLVADYAAGRVLLFTPDGANSAILASNIPKPDGLSVGPNGDIFLVSRDDRGPSLRLKSTGGDAGPSTYLHDVWMVPAGGGLPVRIGSVDESFRLAQAQTVVSGPYQGDLLVLSTRPGLIARFIQNSAGAYERSADFVSYVPGEPTSMAYGRTGELLIGTSDGRVLRYSDTGSRILPDFATGLPVGPMRLTINVDGVVHVTPVGGTSVIRFDPYATRLPDLTGATVPLAAALTTGCSPTPVGQGVTVSLAAGVSLIFDNVVTAGQSCLQVTALGPGVTTTPRNNTIPAYARKLYEDPGFVVYDITTTAVFTDTVAADFFAQNPNARVMVAHGSGNVLDEATVLVTPDDPRSRQPSLSEFVIYLDTRPVAQVTLIKLANLQNALNTIYGPIINPLLLAHLQDLLAQVTTAVGNGGADADRALAISLLKDFKSFTRQNSGEGIPNRAGPDGGGNAAGGLISLADTLVFHLTL